MQPDTFIQIKIPVTLKAAIETVAATDGQSVNAWIVGLLENAVAKAQSFATAKMKAEEEGATAGRPYTTPRRNAPPTAARSRRRVFRGEEFRRELRV